MKYRVVTTVEEILDYVGDSKEVAFDYETAPNDGYRDEDKAALDPAKSHIVTISISVKEGTGIMIPVAHKIGKNIDHEAFVIFLQAFLMRPSWSFKSWEQISVDLGYSIQRTFRLHDAALTDLERFYKDGS